MNAMGARKALHDMEDAMRDAQKRAAEIRRTLDAPPDPKPRHRANLLSWRVGEIGDAVDLIALSRTRLEDAMRAPETGEAAG